MRGQGTTGPRPPARERGCRRFGGTQHPPGQPCAPGVGGAPCWGPLASVGPLAQRSLGHRRLLGPPVYRYEIRFLGQIELPEALVSVARHTACHWSGCVNFARSPPGPAAVGLGPRARALRVIVRVTVREGAS